MASMRTTPEGTFRKAREVYEGHLRNWVIPVLGDVAVANADRAMVREFVAHIRRAGRSQGTVDGA